MNYVTVVINLSAGTAGLMLLIFGLILSLISHNTEKWTKRFFIIFFSILILYVSSHILTQITQFFLDFASATRVAVFLKILSASMLLPLLTLYLLHCCGEHWNKSMVLKFEMILWVLNSFLLVAAQFSTDIYYISPDSSYHRGPWYALLIILPMLVIALILIILFRDRNKLSKKQFISFLTYLSLPLFGMFLQIRIYGPSFIVYSIVFSALFLFLVTSTDQTEKYLLQKEESARQHASLMALQMRPHFSYNTLMSIYYLCSQDTKKAQQVILDFTVYLRKNYTAMLKDDMIPFTEELEHTKAYISVEQVRFENQLSVEFDTPHTIFRLPPLTLQPIVENAVKHGIDPERKPLHISIHTRKTVNGSRITIEDNGPGYKQTDSNEPHIALANIRERVDLMCGGSLSISPRGGGGTVITVLIPEIDKQQSSANTTKKTLPLT